MLQTFHNPKKITIHCSVTQNGKRADIDTIRKQHMLPVSQGGRGFSDVAYHGVIQPDGEWQSGRPLNVVGAHVADDNTGNLGICLIGTDAFSKKQFEVLKYKLETLKLTFGIPLWNVFCHNQFKSAQAQGKSCPNICINHLLGWLLLGDFSIIEPYTYDPKR